MCARGARSPLAPTEPFSGTTGTMPPFSKFRRCWAVASRMPEWPRAKSLTLSAIAARTISASSGAPTPAAWLIRMFSCRRRVSFFEMATSLKAPKPVVTP